MFNESFVTASLETKKPSKRAKYLQKSEGALRNGPNFIFNKMENPILFLMFDIGTKTIRSPLVKCHTAAMKKLPKYGLFTPEIIQTRPLAAQSWTWRSRDIFGQNRGY